MEGRLNVGGDPDFLVRGDLVWICRGKAERLQIQCNSRIISRTTFTLNHRGTPHLLCTVPSSLFAVGMSGTVCICAQQCYQDQAESPEHSEDVANAHSLLSMYRPEAGSRRRPAEMFSPQQ